MAKVPDNDFFYFSINKNKMTSQYSRSPGSLRHVGVYEATWDYCAVKCKR